MDAEYKKVTLSDYGSADDAQIELWKSFQNELMKVLYARPGIKQYLNAGVRHRFFNTKDAQDQDLYCQFFDTPVRDADKEFRVKLPVWQGTYLCRADDKSALFTAFKACVLDKYNRKFGTNKTDVRFRNTQFYFIGVERRYKESYDSKEVTEVLEATLAQTAQFRIKI